jgi:hypothetical protein
MNLAKGPLVLLIPPIPHRYYVMQFMDPFANAAIEALYPVAFTDASGKPLMGGTNYIMHFKPGQTPGVKGFWSITAYNSTQRLVPNPSSFLRQQ